MSGSLSKHKDVWRGYLYLGVRDGKEKRVTQVFHHDHSRAGKRKAEAELRTWVDAKLTEWDHTATETRTVAALLDAWQSARSPSWSVKHRNHTQRWCAQKIEPRIGHFKLDELTPARLEQLYGELLATGSSTGGPLSTSSVKRVHTILRSAYNVALGWGWVTSNPVERATPPKVRRREIHPPSVGQIQQAAAACTADHWAAYLRLAYTTGARRSELLGLTWDDIDLDDLTLTINRGVTAAGGELEIKPPKSGEPRTLSLDVETVGVLKELDETQRLVAEAHGWRRQAKAFVFPSGDGFDRPLHPDSVRNWWRRLAHAVPALEGVRLHDLRHFAATQMLQAGVPVHIVAHRLGHRDTSTTLRIYTHFMPAADRSAADIMGSIA